MWNELGIADVLKRLLEGRRSEFDVERAVYLTVLHRLFASGSDRAAERWREEYRIPGAEGLELHQLYRAMAWLGEALEKEESIPGSPRCTKDRIEEALFDRDRDLFGGVERDETIRGHVFCSFLALSLKIELERRMREAEMEWEWAEVIRGLNQLREVEATLQGKTYILRSGLAGHAHQALKGARVAVPPTLREPAKPENVVPTT